MPIQGVMGKTSDIPDRWRLPAAVLAVASAVSTILAANAAAQDTVAVMVDESPTATQLVERLRSQRAENVAESARIARRLLEEFPQRLVPVSEEDPDLFQSVRRTVERELLNDPELLVRWRELTSDAAAALLTAGGNEEVVRSALLTPAGLEAALRLAQLETERGLGAAALRRLDRIKSHPDLDAAARARAEAIAARAAWIEELPSAIDEPLPPAAVSVDSLQAVESAFPVELDADWRPLWTVDLPDSAYSRGYRELERSGRLAPRSAARIAEDGSLLVSMPAADADTVFINEGHLVRAIDRLSHRERWRTLLDPGMAQNLGAVGDPSVVTVKDGAAVTIAGHSVGAVRTGSGRVICLDAEDGSLRWSTSVAEAVRAAFGEGEDAFPYGPPVIAGDAALVLARRVTNRLESVDYLICLDLERGGPRWLTRLGSSGGIRLGGLRPFSAPQVDGGEVLVAASVGVIASIGMDDGEIRWLRRVPVPLRDTRLSVEPWEVQAPVRIGSRIYAIAPDQTRIVALDGERGSIVAERDFDDGAIGQPRYLIAARDGVGRPALVAVGSDVAVLDPEDLSAPRWRFGEVNAESMPTRIGSSNRAGIRGRVQVVGDAAIVPGLEELLVVDLASGRVRSQLEIDEPGNLVLVDGQILSVSKDTLRAVMPVEAARAKLAARRQDDPASVEWPLAIIDLERAAGNLVAAIAGAEVALAAVEASGDPIERERLFSRLIEVDAAVPPSSPLASETRALLAATALDPSQRIRERLSRGDWHAANGRIAEAFEAWQSVLSDPSLARQRLDAGDVRVVAAVAARERMRALVEREGEAVLAPSEALATLRLERALKDGASAEALLALAREFPLAPAGVEARREAASRLAAARPREALLVLLEGVREQPPERAVALYEQAIELAESRGWIEAASGLRQHAATTGAVADRRRLASEAAGDPWGRAQLGESRRRSRLGPVAGEGRSIAGRLVASAKSAVMPRDAFLTAGDGLLTLHRVSGARLESAWVVPIEDPQPEVLRFGDRMLLWQVADRDRPLPMRIDVESGTVAWVNPSVAELFPPLDPSQSHPFEGQRVIPGGTDPWREAEILPFAVEDQLVMVRRSGDVVSIDAEDGRTVRWSAPGVLDAVFQADAGPLGVVLTGRGTSRGGASMPMAVWIDPEGTVRRTWVGETVGDARWVQVSPVGEIAWGASDGVEVRQLAAEEADDGGWAGSGEWAHNTWESWLLGERLLVREADDRIGSRRLTDGAPSEPVGGFESPRSEGPLAVFGGLWPDANGVSVLFGDRAVRFDRSGRLVGADAVVEDRNYLLAEPIDGQLIVLSFRGAGPVADDQGTPRTEFAYSAYRFGIADGLRQAGPAIDIRTLGPRFDSMRAIDGWLLLSSPLSTVVVPLR